MRLGEEKGGIAALIIQVKTKLTLGQKWPQLTGLFLALQQPPIPPTHVQQRALNSKHSNK